MSLNIWIPNLILKISKFGFYPAEQRQRENKKKKRKIAVSHFVQHLGYALGYTDRQTTVQFEVSSFKHKA